MPDGTVLSLHRWPVKSMGGEDVDALELFEHGAIGDRQQALYWRGGRRLTARAAPRMLAWKARSNGSRPIVTDPDGREWTWDEEGLEQAISDDLGKEVALVEDPALMQDLPDSLLITFQPTLDRLGEELGAQIDLRRFRTNVHVAMDMPPFAEIGWEGRTVRVGDAELELLHPCARCVMVTRDPDTQEAWPQVLRHLNNEHESIFGINARPRGTATIRVGDRVEVA
jgi:uncharacterized protein